MDYLSKDCLHSDCEAFTNMDEVMGGEGGGGEEGRGEGDGGGGGCKTLSSKKEVLQEAI